MIDPTAIVHASASVGLGTRVWAFAQIREVVVIGRDCMIANGAYIDKGVQIGDRCNIHNKALLYRKLRVEEDVFIGPAAAFLNDRTPRANRIRDLKGIKSSAVLRGASIGANVIVMPDLTIGRYAMVAAAAVVTRDVPDHAVVKGIPARVTGFVDPDGRRLRCVGHDSRRLMLSNSKKTFTLQVSKKLYEKIFKS